MGKSEITRWVKGFEQSCNEKTGLKRGQSKKVQQGPTVVGGASNFNFCCSENTCDSQVDWQSLVNVGGHEILEWQARAVGGFKTEAAQQEVLGQWLRCVLG